MVNKTVLGLDSLSHHCRHLSNMTGELFNGRIQMWTGLLIFSFNIFDNRLLNDLLSCLLPPLDPLKRWPKAKDYNGFFLLSHPTIHPYSRMYILMPFIRSRNKCMNAQVPWPPNSKYYFCWYKQLQSLADIFVPVCCPYCRYYNYWHNCQNCLGVFCISTLLYYSCKFLKAYLFLSV